MEQESEAGRASGSRFAPGAGGCRARLGDRAGRRRRMWCDAEVVDDESDDDSTDDHRAVRPPEFADVTQALAQRDEYLDSLRRLQAEFENYKKRVAKQQSRPGGPGRRVPGGEAAPRARHAGSGHRRISATPSRPTGAP